MKLNNNNISKKKMNWYLKKINILAIQKYELFLKKKDIFFLDKIEVNLKCISLSDEDSLLKNNLIILEIITGQKALGTGVFKYIGSTKKFFFQAQISLRKNKLLDFIFFFSICCLGIFYKRNGLSTVIVNKNIYNLRIADYNIFPNYNFINISGNLNIRFKGNLNQEELKFEDLLHLLKIK